VVPKRSVCVCVYSNAVVVVKVGVRVAVLLLREAQHLFELPLLADVQLVHAAER